MAAAASPASTSCVCGGARHSATAAAAPSPPAWRIEGSRRSRPARREGGVMRAGTGRTPKMHLRPSPPPRPHAYQNITLSLSMFLPSESTTRHLNAVGEGAFRHPLPTPTSDKQQYTPSSVQQHASINSRRALVLNRTGGRKGQGQAINSRRLYTAVEP